MRRATFAVVAPAPPDAAVEAAKARVLANGPRRTSIVGPTVHVPRMPLNRSKSMNAHPSHPPEHNSPPKIVPLGSPKRRKSLSTRKIVPVPVAITRSNSNNSSSSRRTKKARKVHPSGSRYSSRSFFESKSRRGEVEEIALPNSNDDTQAGENSSPSKLKRAFRTIAPLGGGSAYAGTVATGIIWTIILGLHLTCIAFYIVGVVVYCSLMLSKVTQSLPVLGAIIPRSLYPAVIVVYVIAAMGHAYFVGFMLHSSFLYRSFRFQSKSKLEHIRPRRSSRAPIPKSRTHLYFYVFRQIVARMWNGIFGRSGLFGVDGPHIEVMLALQELLQMGLQTQQLYRLGFLSSKTWLMDVYVSFAVLNCWMIPVAQVALRAHLTLQRLLIMLSAILLDSMAIVGVPVLLGLPYVLSYNRTNGDFVAVKRYDDVWLSRLLSEAQVVLVSSWYDVMWRVFLAVHLLGCISLVQTLLERPQAAKQTSFVTAPRSIAVMPTTPHGGSARQLFVKTTEWVSSHLDQSSKQISSICSRMQQSAQTPTRALFLVWGVVLLFAYIEAMQRQDAPSCALPVRPWFVSKPACALLEINCRESNSQGIKAEVDDALSNVDSDSLTYLVIRHCPHLEVTASIQSFHELFGIKIQNSTLVSWNADAALTATLHGDMAFITFVDVNMSSVPAGLLDPDFPPSVAVVELVQTNLTALPANLDQRWRHVRSLSVERSQLMAIPNVILNISLSHLSFAGNKLAAVSTTIFQHTKLRTLVLSDNPLHALPEMAAGAMGMALSSLWVDGVPLDSAPSWLSNAFLGRVRVHAAQTSLCQQQQNGSLATTSAFDVSLLECSIKWSTERDVLMQDAGSVTAAT